MLAVKDNQPELREAITDYFEMARPRAFDGVDVDIDEESAARHGRCKERRSWVVEDLRTLPSPKRGGLDYAASRWLKRSGTSVTRSAA